MQTRMRLCRVASLLAVALGIVVLPYVVRAQDSRQIEVARKLDYAGQSYANQGFERTRTIPYGFGRAQSWTAEEVYLDADEKRLVGACDSYCGKLALELYAPGGSGVVDQAVGDDVASVRVRVGAPGTYTVRVWMTFCSAPPCRYGLAVYGR